MKKIKVCSNWDTSQNLTERLIKQFKTDEIDLSNVKFVFDNSYDTIVFFNHITEIKTPNSKSFIFPHEPSWNGTHQKNIPIDTTIFGFDKQNYNQNCVESLAYTFYGGRGPWVDKLDFWSYDNLKKYHFNKSKIVSSSITKINFDYGKNCTYKKRHKLLDELIKIDGIDFFGFGTSSGQRRDSLEQYYFNISVENSHEKNWITEKFYDNILCETIPIYFGCSNIREIYPEYGYILIEDIEDFDKIKKILTEIQLNTFDIYKQKLDGLRLIKEKYFRQNNLLKKIIEL